MRAPLRFALVLLPVMGLAMGCTAKEDEGDLRVEPPATPTASPEVTPPAEEGLSKLGDQLTQQQIRSCQSDEDCELSCTIDGECCPELCGCTRVYNKSFLEELERYQQATCEDPSCPIAKCAKPEPTSAVCNAGLCELRRG
jgi:hypothetical protein